MNAKLQELVENLLEGTRAGILKWTDTAEPGVYRLMLDTGLVRIYRLDLMSAEENVVGCTVLNSEGTVLHDVQVPRREGGFLAELYDLVEGSFQEGALDDLLAEVRLKLQPSSVVITRPENQKVSSTEWVRIEGTHSGVATDKYHYWLMTTNGTVWWPAEDIKFNVNGKWESRINVGKNPGPRSSIAVVVRVTPALHALLTELRRLRHKANDYAGIKIPQNNRSGWEVVTQVEIQIPRGDIKVGETS